MVTWGTNTVHTFGNTGGTAAGPAPAAFSFTSPGSGGATGTSSPGGGGLFGGGLGGGSNSGGGLFGASAPAPATGGLFGSTTPSSGGLFGSTTAGAPSSGFGFGSTSAPAPSGGGLFGTPGTSGGLFGSTTSTGGLFGSTPSTPGGGLFGTSLTQPGSGFGFGGPTMQQQQQQQQPNVQIPAQAALQAHMDAMARQEEARVQAWMQSIHQAYTGTAAAMSEHKSALFTTVLYNPATPEMRQEQWLHGMGVDGRPRPLAPPRPPQVSERDWNQAVIRNPDFTEHMPVAVVGADNLQARLVGQQETADLLVKQVQAVRESQRLVALRVDNASNALEEMNRRRAMQRKRMIQVMKKVELARCFHQPLQHDEIKAMQKLQQLYQTANQLASLLDGLADRARTEPTKQVHVTNVPEKKEVFPVLAEHQQALAELSAAMQNDMHDLKLVQDRVESVTLQRLPGSLR